MRAKLMSIRHPINSETGEPFLAVKFELPSRREGDRFVNDTVSFAPGDDHPDTELLVPANLGRIFELTGTIAVDTGDDGRPVPRQVGGVCKALRNASAQGEGEFSTQARVALLA
jgi:hypothetical protein